MTDPRVDALRPADPAMDAATAVLDGYRYQLSTGTMSGFIAREVVAAYLAAVPGQTQELRKEMLRIAGWEDAWFANVGHKTVGLVCRYFREAAAHLAAKDANAPEVPTQPHELKPCREAFEKWMLETAKCVIGSVDPYPAALERDYWRVWQAAWNARPAAPEIERLTKERDEAWSKVGGLERALADNRQCAALLTPRVEKAEAEAARLRSALERFAVHGIPRIDHTPTRLMPSGNKEAMMVEDFWSRYFADANENVKQDAREALSASPDPVADVVEAAPVRTVDEYHYTLNGHGIINAVCTMFSHGTFFLGEGDALGPVHEAYVKYKKAWEERDRLSASPSPVAAFSRQEVDLFREWFNSVQDVTPEYLTPADHDLAAKIKAALSRLRAAGG